MKKKQNRKYTKKFKIKAIEFVLEKRGSIYGAAKELDMPKSTLAGWIKKTKAPKPVVIDSTEKKARGSKTELEKLKQEMARLIEDRDRLQNALNAAPELAVAEPPNAVVKQSTATKAVQPYDETMLDRAREHWKIGDWDSLVKTGKDALEHHPDRAKLALLVAAGYQQKNDLVVARHWMRLAQEWGCEKKLIAKILIAGVHNTLGKAATINHDEKRAAEHFRSSVMGVNGNLALASRLRFSLELEKIGLSCSAVLPIKFNSELDASPKKLQSANLINLNKSMFAAAENKLKIMVDNCMIGEDFYVSVDEQLNICHLSAKETFWFYCLLSDRFRTLKDNLTALHFLNIAQDLLQDDDAEGRLELSRKFMAIGRNEESLDLLVLHTLHETNLDQKEKAKLLNSYNVTRLTCQQKKEHGHELLLTYLRAHVDQIKKKLQGRTAVVLEIGSTRENVPGQGSTYKLAKYCKATNMHFITVDMDPHNTATATKLFRKLGVGFDAVNGKGEDYLQAYQGDIDFVFLDAYDFDHGKHSKLRQSRYEKFLGSEISDEQCHQMHLECAHAVQQKLSPFGVICVDDTWLTEGKWSAKGTLAVPYLLDNGFEIVDSRNRAALLRRK